MKMLLSPSGFTAHIALPFTSEFIRDDFLGKRNTAAHIFSFGRWGTGMSPF